MTDHLARAKDYIAKGDEYYAMAGDEILAAMGENPELTQSDIAKRVGKSQTWVQRIISARITGRPVDHSSGSNKRDEVTASTLAKADDDQLDRIVRDLPPERREALGEAVQRDGAQEAVDNSLDVQVAKALTQIARIDVLLREGKKFSNLNVAKAERLDRDIEQGRDVLAAVRERVPRAGVRAVA